MEQFQVLRDKAIQKIKVADHMLFMTYPLVQDPKLLLAIIENISASLDYSISALLQHERLFKRIPPYHDTFPSRFDIFQNKMLTRYGLNSNSVKLVKDVRMILSEHKRSPVEFARKDKFVICSPTYSLKTVDTNLVKKYIFETKVFVNNINKIVSKNEGIFTRSQG
ncbi:MAG: hypothetical protein KKF46_05520 [Nanoarchaeota archaeon]|nr:hypothetical protein [Nanoarchaeota archaeon]MBU1321791.1 hypothetical protein [Nanoarchaeota archaeon]MBU1598197.1 hypothetical protein [Nanoarchaeota archaeon]MBU2441666.1 hypothetical protein [Nanoarchaeota archaeon]